MYTLRTVQLMWCGEIAIKWDQSQFTCTFSNLVDEPVTDLPFLFQESEEFLSQLVIKKTIFARIDRPAGIVSFREAQDPNEVLNEWSSNLSSLMSLVSKTTHLINKEEMVHALAK